MRRTSAALLALAIAGSTLFPGWVEARGAGSSSSGVRSSSSHSSLIRCSSCPRDSKGRIERSQEAVHEFKRTHPKLAGCDKCEVDHVVPLSKRGPDTPANLQWLPHDVHREKTKLELYGK